jgi:hypothetical protein
MQGRVKMTSTSTPKADRAAIAALLPDCFEPADDGFCAACGLSAKWTANYGGFEETFVSMRCTFRGQVGLRGWFSCSRFERGAAESQGCLRLQVGFFTPVVFLNSWGSIPAGREIYGTPKVSAKIEVGLEERVMYSHTRLAGANVLSVRSTMHEAAEPAEMPVLAPSWRLKVLPRADGPGAEVMQLIDGAVDPSGLSEGHTQVHICRKGSGVVQFDASPVYDLSGLAPTKYHGAFYLEQDYVEGFATVVHDFLRDEDRAALKPRL